MLLRDNLYDVLRGDILSCRLNPGQDLREQSLAERFATSRAPVRDALLRLARDSLVSVHPRQGYRVAPVSVAAARELLELRFVLEPACAALAARRATASALDHLRQQAEPAPGQDFVDANRGFHAALAQACGNKRLAQAAIDLVGQADRLVRASLGSMQGRDPGELVCEHRAIAAALARRDARQASRLLRAHLRAAEARILEALERQAAA